jgi:hypothetical protein
MENSFKLNFEVVGVMECWSDGVMGGPEFVLPNILVLQYPQFGLMEY